MKHYGDICKIKGNEVEIPDMIVGGSPCQDLSVAGQRKGMLHSAKGDDETTRSGLFMEQIRLTKELRDESRKRMGADITVSRIKPRWFVWENVPGAFSSNNGEDFRVVLEEVCRIVNPDTNVPRPSSDDGWSPSGCIVGDGWSVAWRVHDAQFWGVPQRRKRISLVADFGSEGASEILFERSGLQGNPSESDREGKGTSRNSADGVGETISFQDRCGCEGGAKESSSNETESEHCQQSITKPCCNKVYGISSKDSNAMKSPNPKSGCYEADTSRSLDLNGGDPSCNQGGMVVVGFDAYQHHGWRYSNTVNPLTVGQNNTVRGDTPIVLSDTSDCLTAADGDKGFHSQKMRNPEGNLVIGFSENGFSKYQEADRDLTSLRASGGSNGGGTETLILTPLEHCKQET